jgi:hypothetical protein
MSGPFAKFVIYLCNFLTKFAKYVSWSYLNDVKTIPTWYFTIPA